MDPGVLQRLDVQLDRRLRLDVRVVTDQGAPVRAARVRAREGGTTALHRVDWHIGPCYGEWGPASTDEGGRATIEGLVPGRRYGVWVEAPGYTRGEREVCFSVPDEAHDVVLRLARGGRVVARVLDSRGEAVVRARVAFVPKRDAEPAPAPESPETTPEPGEEEDLDRELGGLSVGVGSFFGPRQVEIYSANTDDRGEAVVEGLPFDRTFTVAVAQDPLLGSEAPVAKVTLAREDPDRTLELRVPPWAPQLVDLDEVTESVLSDAGVSPAPTDRRAEVRPRVQWPLGATPE